MFFMVGADEFVCQPFFLNSVTDLTVKYPNILNELWE